MAGILAEMLKLNEEMETKMKLLKYTAEKRHLDFQEDLINCPVCCSRYGKIGRIPLVGTCGHTICGQCAEKIPNFTCPTCRTGSFSQRTKNFLLYEILDYNNLLEETNIDVNNTILILGGVRVSSYGSWQFGARALVLSPDRSKWIETRLDIPYMTYGSGAAYLNDEIYVFGGGINPKVLYKLDRNRQWIRLADMNVGRGFIANTSVVWDGCIWVLGGEHGRKYLKSVERYDPREDKWTLMPDMKHPRAYAAAVVINNGITITGGTSEKGATNTAERYENGCWMDLPNLPYPHRNHGLVHYKGEMLPIDYCESGHFNASQVEPDTSVPVQYICDSSNGVIIDDEVYALGGWIKDKRESESVGIFDGKNWRAGPDFPYGIRVKSAVIISKHFANRLCAYLP